MLNFAPIQLLLNAWAFVRAFEILCKDLGQVPTVNVFFYSFFFVKDMRKVGWVSLTSRRGKGLLQPFHGSFKGYKDKLFIVKDGKGLSSFVY